MALKAHMVAIATFLAALVLPQHAQAEVWATAARANNGDLFEIDVDSLSRRGALVQSWMKQTPSRPQRIGGKVYAYTLTSRFDDCDGRRYQFGQYFHKDREGDVVSQGELDGNWSIVLPGSIGEGIWRAACALTNPPKEQALLEDISSGQWQDLGKSADDNYYVRINSDKIIKLDSGYVLIMSRSDYTIPTIIDGLPVENIVIANIVDCAGAKLAVYGSDGYIKGRRVYSYRTPESEFRFETMRPRSFAYNSYEQACAKAKAAPSQASTGAGEGVGFGTGWAVAKGYIVTASHVISDGRTIAVYSNGERIGAATVVANDPTNDLAVLRLRTSAPVRMVALPLSDRPASLGKSVFTLGYPVPGVLGQRIKMAAGEVSGTSGIRDDARQIQISVPIQQGNSGGPIIGWDGSVLGVVESKLARFDDDDGSPSPEVVNYAIKTAYLRPLLEDLPDLGNYTILRGAASGDALVDEARKAVFMLVVEK